MGFLVTTLICVIGCLFVRICFNKGPSANLFHITLVITATVCCYSNCLLLDDVGYCVSRSDKTAHCTNPE